MKFQTVVPGSVSLYVLLSYLTSTIGSVEAVGVDVSVWMIVFGPKAQETALRNFQASATNHVVFMSFLTLGLFIAPILISKLPKRREHDNTPSSV